MKIIKEIVKKIFSEGRMITYCGKIISDIKKNVPSLKLLNVWTLADGAVALFRNEEDGNAYEIEIRPISLGKHKELWGDMIKPKIQRSSFNPNKEEILNAEQVQGIISTLLNGLYKRVKLITNNEKEFVFKVDFKSHIPPGNVELGMHAIEHEGTGFFSIKDIDFSDRFAKNIKVVYKKI